MKFLFLFINVVSLITTVVLAAESLKLTTTCPTECAIVQTCMKLNNLESVKYSIEPKAGDPLAPCFCESQVSYLNCVQCAQKKTNRALMDAKVLNAKCNAIGVQSKEPVNLIGNAGAAGNTTATDGTNTNTKEINNGNNNKNTNSTDTNNDKKENGGKSGGSSNIGIIVIGVVAAVAVAGFFVYTRKQKERPESMPFFGNSATSPNTYATLSTPKEMTDMSTSNLTTDYNTQFYPNVDNSNQYGSGYNNQYDNQPQDYNNQYDPNYQDYSNQYGNYESEVAGAVSTTAAIPTVVSGDPAHYESRRESMMPGSQPTMTNFSGAYVCAYKYDPQLDDELQLQVNDQVQIIEEYEDGWMKAINLTTGKEGMAPRVCIKEA